MKNVLLANYEKALLLFDLLIIQTVMTSLPCVNACAHTKIPHPTSLTGSRGHDLD